MQRLLKPMRLAGILLIALAPARADQGRLLRGPEDPQYSHRAVRMRVIGSGPRAYCLFQPEEPRPEGPAPVVLFLHGWMGINPANYGAWIEHLVRRGAVVIYPYYQDELTDPIDFLPNATAAARDAFDVLQTAPGQVRPDAERFAIVGHSAGGNLSALIAASANEAGLPQPKAVVAVMPGEVVHLERPKLDKIPAETLLVVIAGDRDIVVGDQRAREIYRQASAVPAERKEFILFRTDRQGPVPIVADHLAPTGAQPAFDTGIGLFRTWQLDQARIDLLDRFGFWRVADLTLDAAFAGKTLDEVTGRGESFRDLGWWSDGHRVLPPLAGDDLDAIPRLPLPNGARLVPAPRATGRP